MSKRILALCALGPHLDLLLLVKAHLRLSADVVSVSFRTSPVSTASILYRFSSLSW